MEVVFCARSGGKVKGIHNTESETTLHSRGLFANEDGCLWRVTLIYWEAPGHGQRERDIAAKYSDMPPTEYSQQ